MLKQLKLTELCFGKYQIDLYHNGEKISSEEYWDDEKFDSLLKKYEIEGYDGCYTEEEVRQSKKVFEIRSKNVIGGPKEWKFIKQDDNDMPMYKCPICGRKQFDKSKYCGNCGYRLIWEEDSDE